MNKIRGKQIASDIKQDNMFIETDSIIYNSSVTNREYVINLANNTTSNIHQSALNMNMTANNATVGQKACDITVLEFPLSNIIVRLNGLIINVGSSLDCYFSPDGITIRSGGTAQKGDYLYWNSNKFNLDNTDKINFEYLTAYNYYTLTADSTITLNPVYNNIFIRYSGNTGTTMTVIIDGVSFLVGNSGGTFVWDLGGYNQYVFTNSNEKIIQTVNNYDYTIWFDGFGSLLYSVKKGNIYKNFDTINWSTVGVNWSNLGQQYLQSRIQCLCYLENNIFLAGTFSGGTILRSVDNGISWTSLGQFGTNVNVHSIFYVGNGVVLAFTSTQAGIYRSTNYGLNWTLVQTTFGNSGYSPACFNKQKHIYVGGQGGGGGAKLMRSTDSGQTWTDLGTSYGSGQTTIFGLTHLENNIMLMTTFSSGNCYRSIDGGVNWTFIRTFSPSTTMQNITYLGKGVVLMTVFSGGKIARSTDYGLTWTLSDQLFSQGRLYCIENLGNGVVLCGTGATTGKILKSTDYGLTWSDMGTQFTETIIYSMISSKNGVILAGTGSGKILRSIS